MPRSRGHLVWLVRLWPRLSPLSCSRTKQGGKRLGGLEEVRGCNCIVVGGIDRYINKGLLQSIEPGSAGGICRCFGIHGSILNSIVVSSKQSTLHPGSSGCPTIPPRPRLTLASWPVLLPARASPGPSFSRPEAVPQEGPHDDSLCAVSQRFVHVLLFRFLIHLLSCSVIF